MTHMLLLRKWLMVLRSQILAHKLELPTAEQALPGRTDAMKVPTAHFVNGNALQGPFPDGLEQAVFAMGCFWGAERRFWQQPGVWSTAVGYAGGHTPNPTQGMRQGNDTGSQYRSAIYCYGAEQLAAAQSSQAKFQAELSKNGYGAITTEVREAPPFYYAEAYHQQYLAKNPGGYCGLGGTGTCLPD